MSLLTETLNRITPSNKEAANAMSSKLNYFAGNGLGAIQDIMATYAGITGTILPEIPDKATIICCADHGVAAQQVSAYPPETTLMMTTNYLISKGAAANAFANFADSELIVADLGINAETSELPGLLNMRLGRGTADSSQGPAMTREQAITSIEHGITLARECCAKGIRVFLPGEMGISNTTASAAITAAICQLPAESCTGRGTNISDQRLIRKIAIVNKIIEINRPDPADAIDVLAKVGGFELGAIAGIILGAAAEKALTILDGFNSSAAALIACTLCPTASDYLAASHMAGESGHPHIMKKLGLRPVMHLDLKLGEAIGSSLMADILCMGLAANLKLNALEAGRLQASDIAKSLEHVEIDRKHITLTDKTFNYYTNTMGELSLPDMEECQNRINSLAKPIMSLGKIEQIATTIAGVSCNPLPDNNLRRKVFIFKQDGLESDRFLMLIQAVFMDAFRSHSDTEIKIAHLSAESSGMDSFEFGRSLAEDASLNTELIGLCILDENQSATAAITNSLIDETGKLRWDENDFLRHIPEEYQNQASAVLGAMLAAAHNRCLVVIDDAATAAIARYAIIICPELRYFLMQAAPDIYQLDCKISSGLNAMLSFRLIDASMHMLNDMRTFTDTQVPVANDGPGLGKQD